MIDNSDCALRNEHYTEWCTDLVNLSVISLWYNVFSYLLERFAVHKVACELGWHNHCSELATGWTATDLWFDSCHAQ